ncbi:MAG: diacylglycerol kinase family lipid kinase [Elusimicrobia bacterium]|nr:diacylglycerol kinase family lipid kinase [Elusimicrobiota bacterium]
MPKSFYFIINPNAGVERNAAEIADCVKAAVKDSPAKFEISVSKAQGHAAALAKTAVAKGFDAVVVAGGDGTINEVLPAIANSDCALGIIPKGSGNGLARGLKIPLKTREACAMLFDSKAERIDMGMANGDFFINAAGVGIDERIGRAFNQFCAGGLRGRLPYFYVAPKEYLKFKPLSLEIFCNGEKFKLKPFVLAFANGKQYGAGAKIAPKAKLNDGMFDMVMVPAEKQHNALANIFRLFGGQADRVSFVKTITAKEAVVSCEGEIPYHVDGEPRTAQNCLKVKILPQAIKILIPRDVEL